MEQTKQEPVGSCLAKLRRNRSISRQELAELCAEEFGIEADKAKDYIRRVESGRKGVIKPKDHDRIKAILRVLNASEDEVLQVFQYPSENDIVELGLFSDPTAAASKVDEIIAKATRLRQILKRYGIDLKMTSATTDLCSSSLDVQRELSKLKKLCEERLGDVSSLVSLVGEFSSERVPMSQLFGHDIGKVAGDRTLLIRTIDGYLSGIAKARDRLGRVGALFLGRLTRVDEVVLTDFSSAWLSILQRFQSETSRPFPHLRVLHGRGRILSWEDAYQWETVARMNHWPFSSLACNQRDLEAYVLDNKRRGKRFVLASGAEAVSLDGNCLASQGLRLICEEAKRDSNGTVVVAAESYKIRDFKPSDYLWGTDQYRQPYTLDSVPPTSYSVIVTDHSSHWSAEVRDLACCAALWESLFRQYLNRFADVRRA